MGGSGGQGGKRNCVCHRPDLLPSQELLAVDEALARLAKDDADAARLVDLRFFAGLDHQQAAQIMGLTRRQADVLWVYARAWLFTEMKGALDLHQAHRGDGLPGIRSARP